jgi:hypothetical protein
VRRSARAQEIALSSNYPHFREKCNCILYSVALEVSCISGVCGKAERKTNAAVFSLWLLGCDAVLSGIYLPVLTNVIQPSAT